MSNLKNHSNPQRPGYALNSESGLLLFSWPKGEEPTLPFVYSNEVWTGIEYQVAAHLIMVELVKEGLNSVKSCRQRYDGKIRNPFAEYEWGSWYARAMSSYSLIQVLTGVHYDAIEKILYLAPQIKGDFRCFLATATGIATVGIKKEKPFFKIRYG